MTYIKRPGLDEYFIEIAAVVAKRSTCLRNQVGAILVKNKNILTTGYNGAPAGIEHCDVAAEQNAIIQAAMHGISIEGATLYCTHQPCILCAKMIINARVAKVVYLHCYPDQTALDFLEQAGIEVARENKSL